MSSKMLYIFDKLRFLQNEVNSFLAFYSANVVDRKPTASNIEDIRKKSEKMIRYLRDIERISREISESSWFKDSWIQQAIKEEIVALSQIPKPKNSKR